MRIKEAARRTGLTEKTIRYYENRGLVIPDKEERNGRVWRDYTEEQIQMLRAVATLRRAFFHVEEIAGILKISQAAVKKRMQRARQELKIGYIGEVTYEE